MSHDLSIRQDCFWDYPLKLFKVLEISNIKNGDIGKWHGSEGVNIETIIQFIIIYNNKKSIYIYIII